MIMINSLNQYKNAAMNEHQKEIARKASQKYREKHRQEVNRQAREYYQRTKDLISPEQKKEKLEYIKNWQKTSPKRKEIAKRYHESHKEQKAEYGKKYHQTHKEQLQKYQEQWRLKNPEKYAAQIERSTQKLKDSGYITNRVLFKAKRILLEQNPRLGICSMCGQKGRTEIHHIKYHNADPLRDTIEVCARCHRKREQLYGEWGKKNKK